MRPSELLPSSREIVQYYLVPCQFVLVVHRDHLGSAVAIAIARLDNTTTIDANDAALMMMMMIVPTRPDKEIIRHVQVGILDIPRLLGRIDLLKKIMINEW